MLRWNGRGIFILGTCRLKAQLRDHTKGSAQLALLLMSLTLLPHLPAFLLASILPGPRTPLPPPPHP